MFLSNHKSFFSLYLYLFSLNYAYIPVSNQMTHWLLQKLWWWTIMFLKAGKNNVIIMHHQVLSHLSKEMF